jgi:hypothetical protein
MSMFCRSFDRYNINSKKSAHATEQSRLDVLERRRDGLAVNSNSIR